MSEHWPRVIAAKILPRRPRAKLPRLSLFDVNAKKSLSVAPFDHIELAIPEAFASLKHFLRCRRTKREHDMSPELIALLMRIASSFDHATLHVISAHRFADGVRTSPRSQHTRGTAADIRIPSVSVEKLAARAKELGARGIGVYDRSRFVHVDVREKPYSWRDSGEGEDDRRALTGAVASAPSDAQAPAEQPATSVLAGALGAGAAVAPSLTAGAALP